MNKGLVVAVGVLALVALSVWFFTYTPSMETDTATSSAPTTTAKAASPTPAPKKTTPPAAPGVPDSQKTTKSLVTQSGSYQCDYSQVQASGQSTGVIYIYGGKMRGEFRTQTAEKTISNLFVYDGNLVFQWKEGASVGTKTVLNSLSDLPFIIPKDLTSGGIVGSNYESVGWICHPWLTNKSLLTPPSYVTFN
jgi:hypothetical protein